MRKGPLFVELAERRYELRPVDGSLYFNRTPTAAIVVDECIQVALSALPRGLVVRLAEEIVSHVWGGLVLERVGYPIYGQCVAWRVEPQRAELLHGSAQGSELDLLRRACGAFNGCWWAGAKPFVGPLSPPAAAVQRDQGGRWLCPHCGRPYKTAFGLMGHLSQVHGDDSTADSIVWEQIQPAS